MDLSEIIDAISKIDKKQLESLKAFAEAQTRTINANDKERQKNIRQTGHHNLMIHERLSSLQRIINNRKQEKGYE